MVTESARLASALTTEMKGLHSSGLDQRSIPAIAKDSSAIARIRDQITTVDTTHEVILGDARKVHLPSSSVHLVVTSPPYWTLKEYPESDGQLGRLHDYGVFLDSLKSVWEHCYDVLVPGGRFDLHSR